MNEVLQRYLRHSVLSTVEMVCFASKKAELQKCFYTISTGRRALEDGRC